MQRVGFIICLMILPLHSFAQNVYPCNLELIKFTEENMGRLSKQNIGNFLMTIKSECNNNAEFSEWSNEVLHELLKRHPRKSIKVMHRHVVNLEVAEILNNLESPVIEIEDHKKLKEKIQAVKCCKSTRDQIVAAIHQALSKDNR